MTESHWAFTHGFGSKHPHVFGVTAPQLWGATHGLPQSTATPHALVMTAHLPLQAAGSEHPQTLACPPPPHELGRPQPPQSTLCRQPLVRTPQRPLQALGSEQPQLPAPSQVLGAPQDVPAANGGCWGTPPEQKSCVHGLASS